MQRRSSLPSERALAQACKPAIHNYNLRRDSKGLTKHDEASTEIAASDVVPELKVTEALAEHELIDENDIDDISADNSAPFMARSMGDNLDRLPALFSDGTRRRASFSMGDKASDWCKYAQVRYY
jgi:hypothetical protein